MNRTKITLFLGAGFSAPFGHPTMNEFLGFADSSSRLAIEDRSFLGRLVLEARRANSFLQSSATNLEDILSFSEMGERLRLINNEGEKPSDHLKRIIQKIYTDPFSSEGYWKRFSPLKSLLATEFVNLENRLTFVTTNYDLNLESACHSESCQLNPGFALHKKSDGSPQTLGYLYHERGFPIYKLHGSVNWYYDTNETGIAVEDRIVALRNFSANEILSLPYPCTNNYQLPSSPVIIPPSFLKPELPQALKTIWQKAAQALAETNILVFVGYSFPPSDTEMMYFLARALMDNVGIRKIYVVDPLADKIVARLMTSESKIGSHFKDLLIPITSDWTVARLPI